MKTIKPVLGLGALLSLSSVGFAAPKGEIYEPKSESRERKAIFAALRPRVQKQVGRKVIFVGSVKASRSGWAVFNGSARIDDGTPNGKAMSADDLWGSMTGLLRKTGGKWRVLMWNFATDTSVIDRAKKRYPQAPVGLFS